VTARCGTSRRSGAAAPAKGRIRIGVSSCLLGESVRWDGGHKRDRFLTELFARYFEWVPVCPELEVGMGIPREPVRLVGDAEAPRMVATKSGTDWTDRMERFARERVRAIRELDLSGYILKSDSPSCGVERVKVYAGGGPGVRKGVGIFARRLREEIPLLPVEEEGRLHDAKLRENFIERIFAHRRWRDLVASGSRRGDLVAFHTAHKLLILSHGPEAYRRMGRLVAEAKQHPPRRLAELYGAALMEALRIPATTRSHFNVLQHLAGHLTDRLEPESKRELHAVLEDYRRGLVPLVVPITLLKHHVARHDIGSVRDQVYLSPHPEEMMLRNHAGIG
jgi:uncharacterized protein YbgA (DUF1722 family)/uncharacterized protein YbbK (DUF523 family)